jgi:hypothetical protein
VDYLILNFEGTDGGTDWTEEAQSLSYYTANNCVIDSDQFYEGASSLLLDRNDPSSLEYVVPGIPADFITTIYFRFNAELDFDNNFFPVAICDNDADTYINVILQKEIGSGDLLLSIEGVDNSQNELTYYIEPIELNTGEWHKVKCEVNGTSMTVEINDILMYTTTIVAGGFVGLDLVTVVKNSDISIWVDSIRLESEDEPEPEPVSGTISVIYKGNGNTGGAVPVDVIMYELEETVTVLGVGSLTKFGYIFDSWNTIRSGDGTSYDENDTFDITDTVILYAQWTAVDEYDDEYDLTWYSQGTFFIERPTFQVGINTTTTGVWGRQSTALLGEPFAQKITKIWDADTTFYAICQEIIESVGLDWDSSRCDIQDFTIYADNFECDDLYPIEALKSLVELIVGEEGYVTSDRLGDIWIRRLERVPETSIYDITDLVVQSINEEPEWPEFGNRIKIIPSETMSQDSIEIYMENQCIGTGSSSYIDVYAQVKNGDGVPINDAVVSWSFDPPLPENIWYKYPSVEKSSLQNSSVMLVSNELKRATGFSSVELSFEPTSIIGIWAYADKLRATNFAPEAGYVIDGKNVFLTEESFSFCDQQVFISYYAAGMARNKFIY